MDVLISLVLDRNSSYEDYKLAIKTRSFRKRIKIRPYLFFKNETFIPKAITDLNTSLDTYFKGLPNGCFN